MHTPCALRARIRVIGPIGALYALVLWTGNSAYLYISVSFIQMLKVPTPVPTPPPKQPPPPLVP